MTKTYRVAVTQIVEVTLDEAKFDETFMQEFRESFYQFDTLEEHAEHIAQLQARGLIDISWNSNEFVEGYGEVSDFDLVAKVIDTEIDPAVEMVPA